MDYSLFPTIPVQLERSNLDQNWGFRLQGGVDFRIPLSIKKITPNSPSHNKLYPGDGLVFIDGIDVSSMKHEDAGSLIRNSLQLQLILRRVETNRLHESTLRWSGQLNMIRPSKAPVKFAAGSNPSNPRTNSALYNTKTPNNYRRF